MSVMVCVRVWCSCVFACGAVGSHCRTLHTPHNSFDTAQTSPDEAARGRATALTHTVAAHSECGRSTLAYFSLIQTRGAGEGVGGVAKALNHCTYCKHTHTHSLHSAQFSNVHSFQVERQAWAYTPTVKVPA